MPSKYIINNPQSLHFITFSTVQWVDALSRPSYKDIIIESLRYCQKNKGLMLYAYVIMNNHVHLIASAKGNYNLSNILRDLKKHTSKKLFEAIQNNIQESRKSWMMWIFKSAGKANSNNKYHQLWQHDNHPIELSSNHLIQQKLDYIHRNPVKAGIVYEPHHYIYSSAFDYAGGTGILEIDFL
ncbi:REP-associated tyrosine transposase [Flexithrix dorotheae]|uniref:REP-associated tyrosine transposase n=1 Tax=Flexithrix dorotheae TaxID=70993 RepID=UPI0003628EAD|nr:transposase [Flexithrix dorotheae]